MSRCSRANATTFSKNPRSTHMVVGLCGNERIRSFALGHASFAVSSRRAKKSPSSVSGTERRSPSAMTTRSEEHTSELQSQSNLVCRLLLEKKKKDYHVVRAAP